MPNNAPHNLENVPLNEDVLSAFLSSSFNDFYHINSIDYITLRYCESCLFVLSILMRIRREIHYDDVTMSAIASQITSLTIVYSIIYFSADQRKHQSSAILAFVREIHRRPVNSPHKGPVTLKMFPFDDVIMMPRSVGTRHGGSQQHNINSRHQFGSDTDVDE